MSKKPNPVQPPLTPVPVPPSFYSDSLVSDYHRYPSSNEYGVVAASLTDKMVIAATAAKDEYALAKINEVAISAAAGFVEAARAILTIKNQKQDKELREYTEPFFQNMLHGLQRDTNAMVQVAVHDMAEVAHRPLHPTTPQPNEHRPFINISIG